MAENEKAVPGADTPSDDGFANVKITDVVDDAAETLDEAQESVDDLKARIRDLEAKSTKAGRSHKAELDALKSSLEEKDGALKKAVDDNRRWIQRELGRQDLAPETRRSLEAALGMTNKPNPKDSAEKDMWRAIATEEDPKVRKALVRRAERGKFLDADEIKELRADLLAEDDDSDKDSQKEKGDKKPAPKVGVRTAGTVSRTVDQRIEDAKKSKDPSALFQALVEKAKADRANARG